MKFAGLMLGSWMLDLALIAFVRRSDGSIAGTVLFVFFIFLFVGTSCAMVLLSAKSIIPIDKRKDFAWRTRGAFFGCAIGLLWLLSSLVLFCVFFPPVAEL